MKTKEIHDFVKDIVNICQKKVKEAEEKKTTMLPYEEGRLYEASYILQNIENIIYKD